MVGNCSNNAHPDMWFPELKVYARWGRPKELEINRNVTNAITALSICKDCPITDECLAEGMRDENLTNGIWGGKMAGERLDLAGLDKETMLAQWELEVERAVMARSQKQ